MKSWIRNSVIIAILLGFALAVFLYKDLLFASIEKIASSPETQNTTTQQQEKKITNAAALGLSNFYAKVYGEKGERKVINNVIFLPEPEGDLVEILQTRAKIIRPYPKDWHGTTESRAFRRGETLYQKLSEYASNEGLDLMWWINKDFIIKEPFRINNHIINTTKQIGYAIAGEFPESINSYFCYQQRTLVLINNPITYLDDTCIHLH